MRCVCKEHQYTLRACSSNVNNTSRFIVLGRPFDFVRDTFDEVMGKLIKIGAKVVRHSRQIIFQMAEVAVPRELFRAILEGIERLRLATATSG